ncbi:MAG: hypothetical protein AAF208_03800 [Cyanobacteria bacterium P01_A01_bin.45]
MNIKSLKTESVILNIKINILVTLVLSSILGLSTTAKADNMQLLTTESRLKQSLTQSLTQYSSVPQIYCPGLEKITRSRVVVAAATKEFHVNICSSVKNPARLYYVSSFTTQVGKSYILLPIAYKTSRYYAAREGQYLYVLHLKRKQLRIYKRGQLLVKQNIYRLNQSEK